MKVLMPLPRRDFDPGEAAGSGRVPTAACRDYVTMQRCPRFRAPHRDDQIGVARLRRAAIPPGAAKDIRECVEDKTLEGITAGFSMPASRSAAICRGVEPHALRHGGCHRICAERSGEPTRFRSVLFRDHADDPLPVFVVRDRRYVSARWPRGVHTFAQTFAQLLTELEMQT